MQPDAPKNGQRPNYADYLLESAWVLPSIALPVAMFVALLVTTFVAGAQMPGMTTYIDPAKIDTTAPFDKPGVVQVGPNEFNVAMVVQTWQWTPNTIKLPVGARVHFSIVSRDVMHGLLIDGTNVNLMIEPGYISHGAYTFTKPGTYRFVCQEYCGIGHQTMIGQVIVGGQQ
ncbi:MAG: cytochrome c oxidase subunit II [Chloroflexi bacterium]|nr:cytochrome c oxidase subunit II [Chloroflexota bacterium]